tara:strand:+ start:1552 stop:1782 length:231 start_codon:yes stop_codon:yes gene_type:complete
VIIMNDEVKMNEHIELLSIIKDQLNEIPADKLIRWNREGDIDNAQFVFLQFLKETIRKDGSAWITQFIHQDYHGAL